MGRTAAAVWRVAGPPERYIKVVGDAGQYGPVAAGRLLRRHPLPADPRLLAYHRLLDEFF